MAPHPGASSSRSPQTLVETQKGIVPVVSASWPEGSSEPVPASSIPAAITTQELNAASAASFPSTYSSKSPKLSSTKPTKALQVSSKKRHNAKSGARVGIAAEKPKGDSVTARRQKRLERNRESARLSRRRRKHYLEVLEDRVTQLSVELDQGRREHAARAIETVLEKRLEILKNGPSEDSLLKLDGPLNRTSQELSVVSTFYTQQLKSFSLAPHTKFVLWLTLQGDTYFRGGRAASERLSAARIGERVSMQYLGLNDIMI
jgi:hypothetical protein